MIAYLRKAAADFGHVSDELDEVIAFAAQTFPTDPSDWIVLAIGVVVAVLGVADLVAGEEERNALCKQQASELIFPQPVAKRIDLGIIALAFMAAIVAVIIVGAVAIILAISLVMLGVVAEHISQREAVMYRDVIDAGPRRSP